MFSPTIKGVRNPPMFAPVFHKPQYVPRSSEANQRVNNAADAGAPTPCHRVLFIFLVVRTGMRQFRDIALHFAAHWLYKHLAPLDEHDSKSWTQHAWLLLTTCRDPLRNQRAVKAVTLLQNPNVKFTMAVRRRPPPSMRRALNFAPSTPPANL
jgi:hypothetical protein